MKMDYDSLGNNRNTSSKQVTEFSQSEFKRIVDQSRIEIMTLNSQLAISEEAVYQAQENELKFRSIFEMSSDAILIIEDERFVDCNRAVLTMLGYKNKAEFLNTHPSELSPEKQPDGRYSYEKAEEMMRTAFENGSHHFEWIHTKSNGENFPVEVWLSTIEYRGKKLINTIWRDLTEKKKAEQTIKKNIEEKEILLKEIHHRVKNNFQIISSLINLQAGNIENQKIKSQLLQCKFRVESMSRIHEMMYGSKDLSKINYGDYLKSLITNLITTLKGNNNCIQLEIDVENLYLTINTAIPLGLLINEIITNSLKYGIVENNPGKIFVQINSLSDRQLKLLIGDNGVGYPKELTMTDSTTLGFQLIQSLTEQLNGVIERNHSLPGTNYSLLFEKV